MKALPARKTKCATCPFRVGSPYAALSKDLGESALTNASRVCHSTGSSAIFHRTGKPPALCRGARDIQLAFFKMIGFIAHATDAAWAKKLAEIQAEKRQAAAYKRRKAKQECGSIQH